MLILGHQDSILKLKFHHKNQQFKKIINSLIITVV